MSERHPITDDDVLLAKPIQYHLMLKVASAKLNDQPNQRGGRWIKLGGVKRIKGASQEGTLRVNPKAKIGQTLISKG